MINRPSIAIIGLGYVGLPLAVEFCKKYPTIGFDLNHNSPYMLMVAEIEKNNATAINNLIM